jgi:hypothetical protein
MTGQTYRLENRWWVKYQKAIPYRDDLIMNRTSWAPIKQSTWVLKDGDWVDFELKKTKVGSTTNGPVYEEYALLNGFINED